MIRSFKKRRVFRIVIAVVIVTLVLINPIPVMVSASEQAISGVASDLNLPSLAPITSTPQTQTTPVDINKLTKYMTVESAFLGLTDNVSVFFKDLNSGQEFSILPDKSWIPASIIKAYVAAYAFEARHEGWVDFNSRVTITADNVVPNPLETDEFPRLREGTNVTIGQLVQAMVIQSDNTAYNTLLDVLDRRNVMTYIKNLGIGSTIVGEKLNVDDNQQRRDSTNAGYQYNVTTAGDYAKVFELMYNHQIPDSDELLAIFKRQKFDSMIPAMIPPSVPVAHKTGEWAPIYHDGGIVYKSGAPFLLAIFSNSNSPTELAKLAQVAYFQDANHVDAALSSKTKNGGLSQTSSIRLADVLSAQKVLAASTFINTSAVTATDLGITPTDLGVNASDSKNVPFTLITPASPIYGLKLFIENFRVSRATTAEKPALELSFAKERLSELKTVSGVPNQTFINSINNTFESNIKSAATLSEKNSNKDELLLSAKQLNDSHFVVMGSSASNVSSTAKDQFINNAYQNITQNQTDVAPIVKNSPLAIASQIEPVVGTVNSVQDGVANITLDTGKKTDVVLDNTAKVRSFGQTNQENTSSIDVGQKIAVVGVSEPDGKIAPVFIMNDVPKVIPKTQGVVVEIQPQDNLIKIENSQGQIENIQVDQSTLIKAKDTGVSLEGIKAGSVITVVGNPVSSESADLSSPSPSGSSEPVATSSASPVATSTPGFSLFGFLSSIVSPNSSSSASPTLNPTSSPSTKANSPAPLSTPKSVGTSTPAATTKGSPSTTTQPATINAQSVTITVNGSGKSEVVTTTPAKSVATPVPAKTATAAPVTAKPSTPAPATNKPSTPAPAPSTPQPAVVNKSTPQVTTPVPTAKK